MIRQILTLLRILNRILGLTLEVVATVILVFKQVIEHRASQLPQQVVAV